MRKNSKEVRDSSEEDERANKGIKRRSRADVYSPNTSEKHAAGQRCVERTVPCWTDSADPFRERGRVVAAEGEDRASGGDVASNCGAEYRGNGYGQETDGAGFGSCCLEVDVAEGADGVCGHDCREVVDGVGEGGQVAEAGDEADDNLAD